MRSVVSDGSVSLLLFDEPSAILDPTAEHGSKEIEREQNDDIFFPSVWKSDEAR